MKKVLSLAAVLAMTAITEQGGMASVTFGGAGLISGENLAASATFTDLGGGQLGVTLVNTYTNDTPDQSAVLTGVFFNYAAAGSLVPVSAAASAGSTQWSGTTHSAAPSSAVLGTEWAYGTGSAPHGANAGIVSSGYYTPGSGNFAAPGDALDGSAYGILSAGYAGSDLDGLSTRIYVQNSMSFILSGFSGSLSGITAVSFQYGTSTSEPNLVASAVPEPGVAALASLGALALLGGRRQIPAGPDLTAGDFD